MINRNLANITIADLANAETKSVEAQVCPAGEQVAKVLAFVEEETYNYVSLEINGVKYNFFYNYFLKDSDKFNADVLNWIIGLSTIPVTETTSLIDITNSAIGSSYKVEIYNYVSKTGKNAGKTQHSIQFNKKPELVVVEVQTEEFVLPF